MVLYLTKLLDKFFQNLYIRRLFSNLEVFYLNKFNKICQDIKNIKIQGAENIAKSALIAYSINPTKKAVKKLIGLGPTEPLLVNILNYAVKNNVPEYVGECTYNTQSYRGHDHEAMNVIVNAKLLPKNCLTRGGYLEYSKRNNVFKLTEL